MKYFRNSEYPEITYNSIDVVDGKKLEIKSKKDIVCVPDELHDQYNNVPGLTEVTQIEKEPNEDNTPVVVTIKEKTPKKKLGIIDKVKNKVSKKKK